MWRWTGDHEGQGIQSLLPWIKQCPLPIVYCLMYHNPPAAPTTVGNFLRMLGPWSTEQTHAEKMQCPNKTVQGLVFRLGPTVLIFLQIPIFMVYPIIHPLNKYQASSKSKEHYVDIESVSSPAFLKGNPIYLTRLTAHNSSPIYSKFIQSYVWSTTIQKMVQGVTKNIKNIKCILENRYKYNLGVISSFEVEIKMDEIFIPHSSFSFW